MSLKKKNNANRFLKQTCRTNLFSILFCSHILQSFCEQGQLKGWQPRFQPAVAKSLVCSSHRERIQCIVTILAGHNSVTKPSPSLHETGFFSLQLQQRDRYDATIVAISDCLLHTPIVSSLASSINGNPNHPWPQKFFKSDSWMSKFLQVVQSIQFD